MAFYTGAVNTYYEWTCAPASPATPPPASRPPPPRPAAPDGHPPGAGLPHRHPGRPVTVAKGSNFAVLLRLTTPGYAYPIPVRRPNGLFRQRHRRARPSFISADAAPGRTSRPTARGGGLREGTGGEGGLTTRRGFLPRGLPCIGFDTRIAPRFAMTRAEAIRILQKALPGLKERFGVRNWPSSDPLPGTKLAGRATSMFSWLSRGARIRVPSWGFSSNSRRSWGSGWTWSPGKP